MKIIVAPDSFKGVLSARQAAKAIADGAKKALEQHCRSKKFSILEMPVADGGEGTAEALAANSNAVRISADASDPLGNRIKATYWLDPSSASAFIDVASASGLPLIAPHQRNPMDTSTFGTGMLIADAISRGARHIFIGAGGSATTDGGCGALQALGAIFFDHDGIPIRQPARGRDMPRIHSADTTRLDERLKDTEIIIACDVTAPLTGDRGAARVFAAQKGASPEEIETLENGLLSLQEIFLRHTGGRLPEGSGAAGGFAAGMAALAGARICRGATLVLNHLNFRDSIRSAALIITGEGKADRQTLMGKAPYEVMAEARLAGIPAVLLAGSIQDKSLLLAGGFAAATDINSGTHAGEDPLDPDVASRRLNEAAYRAVVSELVKQTL